MEPFEHTTVVQAVSQYDKVKGEFFDQYVRTRVLYENCMKREGEEKDERMEHWFKASLIALSMDLLPKIRLARYPEHYKELEDLNESSIRMNYKNACRLFKIARLLVEENGLTKYEFDQVKPKDYTLKGAVKKA